LLDLLVHVKLTGSFAKQDMSFANPEPETWGREADVLIANCLSGSSIDIKWM